MKKMCCVGDDMKELEKQKIEKKLDERNQTEVKIWNKNWKWKR